LVRLVKFQVFSELFEQLEDFISSFVLDGPHEERSQQIVVNLHLLSLRRQHDESFCVLLEPFASFQKQHEAFEGGWIDRIIVLQ
jgi:hypothetical protein